MIVYTTYFKCMIYYPFSEHTILMIEKPGFLKTAFVTNHDDL